jgi:trehalose 6-phosphate phosphatase
VRNILHSTHQTELDDLGRADVLVGLDFDGTLAPLVDDPAQARMRERTEILLRLVALLYPTAVISERSRADLGRRVACIPLAATVGSHGAEPGIGPLDLGARRRVSSWLDAIREPVERLRGVVVEDNGFSLSIHYRHAPSRALARRAITSVLQALPGARIFPGRAVVTVAPAEALHKGQALETVRVRTGCSRAIYVGDDRTDEDAFRSPGVALAIRIGRTSRTSASAYLPAQADIDELLRRLASARRRARGLRGDTVALERLLALR